MIEQKKGIFITYCQNAKAYRSFMTSLGRVVISRDVCFVEHANWNLDASDRSAE